MERDFDIYTYTTDDPFAYEEKNRWAPMAIKGITELVHTVETIHSVSPWKVETSVVSYLRRRWATMRIRWWHVSIGNVSSSSFQAIPISFLPSLLPSFLPFSVPFLSHLALPWLFPISRRIYFPRNVAWRSNRSLLVKLQVRTRFVLVPREKYGLRSALIAPDVWSDAQEWQYSTLLRRPSRDSRGIHLN